MRAIVMLAALITVGAAPAHRQFLQPNLPSSMSPYLGDFEFLPTRSTWTECDSTTPVNVATRSEDMTNGTWQKESGITATADQAVDAFGNTTMELIDSSAGGVATTSRVYQTMTGGPSSATYTASVYVRAVTGTVSVSLGINGLGTPVSHSATRSDGGAITTAEAGGGTNNSVYATATGIGTTPVRLTITLTGGTASAGPSFLITAGAYGVSKNNIYAGNVMMNPGALAGTYIKTTTSHLGALYGSRSEQITFTRTSTATCTKTDGTVVTLAANQPRLEQHGLLVEGASTNAALNSAALDSWSSGAGVTVTANQATAPDGTTSMDLVDMTAASDTSQVHYLSIGNGGSATTMTWSVWARAVSGTGVVSIGASGTTCSAVSASRSDGGTITTGATGAAYCYAYATVGTTPVRLALTATFSSAPGSAFSWVYGGQVFSTKAMGLFWGAQMEFTSSFASSYIATAGTAVTRTAESATITTPSALSDVAGVAKMTFRVRAAVNGQRVIGTGSSGQTLGWIISASSIGAYDETSTRSLNLATTINGRSPTLRVTWTGSNSMTLVEGANTNTTAYDGTILTTVLALGSQSGTSNHLNGWLKDICLGNTTTECL